MEFADARLIIQYGPPRTASTLQFQILCAAMYLVHDHEPERCLCRFGTPTAPGIGTSQRFEVVKSHKYPPNPEALARAGALVFATATNSSAISRGRLEWRATAQRLSQVMRLDVAFVQITSHLARRGYLIAADYQRHLGLTDAQLGHVIEYIRYWSVLRQCCGREMSADWRARLRNDSGRTTHHSPGSGLYPACEIYDLDAVERALMQSYVYRRFHAHARRLRSFSANDGEFDGHYCSRTNRQVQVASPARVVTM